MLRKIILVALAAVVTHSFGAAQAPQVPAKTVVAAQTDGKPLYVAGPVSDELKQKCTQTVTWNADDTAWLRTDFMASPSFALVEESTRPAVKQIRGFLDAAAVMRFACVFLDTKEHFYVSVTPQKTVDGQKAFPAVVVHGASKTEPAEFLVFLETVATKQAGGSWLSSILKGIGAVGTALAGKVFVLDPFLNKRRADADASAAKAAAEKARLAQEKLKADVCAEIKVLETELGEGPFDTKDKDLKTLEAERDRLKLLKEVRDKAEQERLAEEARLAAERVKAERLAAFNAAKMAARSKECTICGAQKKAIEIQGIQGGWTYLALNKILELDGTTDANRLCTYLIRTISPIKLQTSRGVPSDLAKALGGDKQLVAAARKALQSNLDYLDPKPATEDTLYHSWSGSSDGIRGVLRQDLETYIQFHRDLLAELDRLTQEAQRVAALLEQIRALEAERDGDRFDETGKTAAQCEVELARLKQTKARPAPRVDASGSTGSVTSGVDSGRGATGSGIGDRGLRTAALLASLKGMVGERESYSVGFYNSDGTINFQHEAFDAIRQQILDEIERDMSDVKTVQLYKTQCSMCGKQGKFEIAAETWCADCKENTRVICEEIASSAWQDISDAQIITLIKHPRNVTLETLPQVQSKFQSAADVVNAIGSKFAVAKGEFTEMVALADKAEEVGKIHAYLSARQGVEGGILKTGYLSDSVVEFNAKDAPVCLIAPCPENQRARFGLLDAESQESLPGLLVCCAHRSLMEGKSKFNENKKFYVVHDSFGINIFPLPMVEAEDIDGLQEDFLSKPGVMQALDTAVAETLLAGKRVVFACRNGQNRSTGMMYFYLKRLLGNAVSWYKLTSWVHFNRNDCFDLLGAFSPSLPNYCPKTKLIQQGLLRYVMADDFKKRGLLPVDFTYETGYQWPLGFGGASIEAAGSFFDDADDEDVPDVTLPGGSRRGGASARVPDELLEVTGLAAQRLAEIKTALPSLKSCFVNNYSNADLFEHLHVVPNGRSPHYPVTDIGCGVAFDATRDFQDPLLSFHKICDGLSLGNNDVINYLLGLNASSGPKLAQINNLGKGNGGSVMGWCDFALSNPQRMDRLPTLVITFDDKNPYPRLKEGEVVPIAGVECLYLPLPETTEGAFIKLLQNKRLLFEKIIEHLNKPKGNVLFHCHAGNHRSVGALLYFLFEAFKREVPLFDLSEYIYSKRAAAKTFYDLAQGTYNDKGVSTMPTTNLLYQVMVHCCGASERS